MFHMCDAMEGVVKMGECGCGETRPHKIIDLGDSVMVVEIYPGCLYCDTGIMVTLNKLTYEDAKVWGWEPDTKFEPDEVLGIMQLNFPIISKEDLIEAAKQMGFHESDELIGGLQEEGLELLQNAISIRLSKTSDA